MFTNVQRQLLLFGDSVFAKSEQMIKKVPREREKLLYNDCCAYKYRRFMVLIIKGFECIEKSRTSQVEKSDFAFWKYRQLGSRHFYFVSGFCFV